MEVNKVQAAKILGCSIKKVVKMIKDGELQARKKSSSKFSDWIITLPDSTVSAVSDKSTVVEKQVAEIIRQTPATKPLPVPIEQKVDVNVTGELPENAVKEVVNKTVEQLEKIEEKETTQDASKEEDGEAGDREPRRGTGGQQPISKPSQWWFGKSGSK